MRQRQALLIGTLLLYVLIEVVPGRFTTTDEVAYKAAGLHWALYNTFSAPELSGFLKSGPPLEEIYFAQPPLYPFFYGLFTRLVGFGPRQCILFDTMIHVALALILGLFAKRIMSLPVSWSFALAAAVLPLGTYGRPDELGMCFGFAGLLVCSYNLSDLLKGYLSGVAFGFCLATSAGTFMFVTPLFLYYFFQQDLAPRSRARLLLRWSLCAVLVVLACILPILINHPKAYEQIYGHLGKRVALVSLVSGEHSVGQVSAEIVDSWRHSYNYFAVLAASYLIGLVAFLIDRRERRVLLREQVVPAILLVVLGLVLPDKPLYTWFVAPWLIASSLAAFARSVATLSAGYRTSLHLFVAVLYLTVCVPYVKNKLTLLTLPGDQTLDINIASVRNIIPPGARVMTLEYWWALADRCSVVDPMFSNVSVDNVDYVVKTGNGSGLPGVALPFEQYEAGLAGKFIPVANHLNQHPLYIGPIRVTNSAYGFGALVLARRR